MTPRTLEWAARVAADATDRRAREAGRDDWDASDYEFYRLLFKSLPIELHDYLPTNLRRRR